MSPEQSLAQLKEKLLEEAYEVKVASTQDDLRDEIADTLEVIESLLQFSGLSWEEIQKARQTKNEKRGAFLKAIYISTVETEDKYLKEYCRKDPLKYPQLHSFEKNGASLILHEHAFAPVDQEIFDRLLDFNAPYLGEKRAQYFTVEAKQDETLIGGANGFIKQDVCLISNIYVDEQCRKQGLGRELIRIIENFAQEKNCTQIDLETFEFQAREFYEKLGFLVLQKVDQWMSGQTLYFMRKQLSHC